MTQTPAIKSPSARARILTAAKSRFAAAGFEGTSTRQIAEKAGVAQSLLLYHFASKDELWRAVMDAQFERADALRQAVTVSDSLSIEDRLMAGVDAFITLCAEDPDLHRLMTIEGRSKSDRLEWLVETHLRRFFGPTRDLIVEGQKQGVIRNGDPVLLYYTIIAIAGSVFSFEPEMSLLEPRNNAQNRETVSALIRQVLFAQGS